MGAELSPPIFSRITVIGAGVMGHGIAVVHALGCSEVVLYDLDPSVLDRAMVQIEAVLLTMRDAGQITQDEAYMARPRISCTTDMAVALAKTDYVVEAITEDVSAKRSLFTEIASLAPADAILTSNTSYLDIFPEVPEGLKPRTLIVHWYTPPYIIDLVDVVPSPNTPEKLVGKVVEYLEALGKIPVRMKKFVPGYLANRIQMAIESEVFRLLDDEVAEVADIDCAIREGLAMRLALFGQFRKIDYTGVRIVRDSHNLGIYVPPTPPTGARVLDEMVAAGKEGVTHGEGFYDYAGVSPIEAYRDRDRAILALKAFLRQTDD